MKIGIIYCAYNCKSFAEKSVEPFLIAKNENIISAICAVSLPFFEYFEINQDKDDTTDFLLNLYKNKKIDNIFTQPNYIQEHKARDLCLQYLKIIGCDTIWMVDGDEFYSTDNIKAIISFIEKKIEYVWYKINFKNYIFDGTKWIDGFCPPRIFRVQKDDFLLDKFYWDNDMTYKTNSESISYQNLKNLEIPKEIAHIKHMTWLHSNSENKYKYQMKHFGDCGYKWNEEMKRIEINKAYYIKNKLEEPLIHEDN
jgi:hypothetical protein